MDECREYIIDDSTLIKNSRNIIEKDYSIKVGMVREYIYVPTDKETRYVVELWDRGRLVPVTCSRMTKFGGLYNYEEFNYRGFDPGKNNISYGNFSVSPGDNVLVAYINGESTEGVILGSMRHFGRQEILPIDGTTAYASEFNGLETVINKYGEYRVTFKGAPSNLSALSKAPDGKPYPAAEYDESIAYSFYQFDKKGSYLLTDNSKTGGTQFIKIDKSNGKIIIGSGNTSLVINKKEETYVITNKKVTFNTTDEWNLNTKKTAIKSTDLIQADAKDIKTKGKWSQEGDMEIKGKIKQTGNTEITGNFKTTGTTSLAGGSYPLIYDIALTIGVGNLGAPVISSHVLLKTSMTKAT